MKWIVTVLLVLFFRTGLIAQPIDVGLFQDQLVKAAVVYCSSGYYQLLLDGEVIKRMEEGDILYLNLEEGMVKVLDSERDLGLASNVELRSLSTDGVIRVRCISPEIESRVYDDNLLVVPDERFMTLVNRVDLDKYLAGVVETEAGANAGKEFYKAQSVLCRTFALKQMDRHSSEGFSLCDGRHCQAYRG